MAHPNKGAVMARIQGTDGTFYATCYGCGRRTDELWADLDGPAFKAYYCRDCTMQVTNGKTPPSKPRTIAPNN